jgi:hypothetical protein
LQGGPSDGAVEFKTTIDIERPGFYRIGLAADDQAEVAIDGRVIVDTTAQDGGNTQLSNVLLLPGSHTVDVRYLDTGGPQSLEVTWNGADTDRETLPLGDKPGDDILALFSDAVAERSFEEDAALLAAQDDLEDENDFI